MLKFSPSYLGRRLFAPALVVASALLLNACASYQGIGSTASRITRLELATPATTPDKLAATRAAWPQDHWWLAYADPQLNALVEQALGTSPTLALAQSRIARAQAAVELSQAAGGAQAGLGADASYGRQSANYIMPKPPLGIGGTYVSQGRAALDFSYDLDLWDKNGALIRASAAQANATAYELAAARLALSTALVRSYAQLAAQYEMQDLLLAMQKQRDSLRTLAQQRLASGLDTRVELKQSETSVAALKLELVQLDTALEVTRLQISALAGRMPAAAKDIVRPNMSSMPLTVPEHIPLDLLGRRPELAAQSARIEAAIGEAQVAKAQFYPNISLSGFAGFQAIGLDKLLSAGSFANGLGPAIHLPIFDSGRLRANYAGKTADIDAAIHQYNQSVLSAAQDVAEQLTRMAALAREEQASNTALAASEEAYRLAMLRYRGQLAPYLTALTVETQLLAQRRVALELKAKRQDVQIALVRALGGGFVDHPIEAPAI